MRKRHRTWATQFYNALLSCGRTWTRDPDTLYSWANQFAYLEADVGRKTLERVLDWFCSEGCGALYVPIVCTGERFCERFWDIEDAKRNLKNQTLVYFDDVLKYTQPKLEGSRIQRERQIVVARVERQIRLVDDLAHKRCKLPKQKPKPVKTESLSKAQRAQLSRLLIVDRDVVWTLLMERPDRQLAWIDYLDEKGFFKRLRKFGKRSLCPF